MPEESHGIWLTTLRKTPRVSVCSWQPHDLCPLIEVTEAVVEVDAPGVVLLEIVSHLIDSGAHQKT